LCNLLLWRWATWKTGCTGSRQRRRVGSLHSPAATPRGQASQIKFKIHRTHGVHIFSLRSMLWRYPMTYSPFISDNEAAHGPSWGLERGQRNTRPPTPSHPVRLCNGIPRTSTSERERRGMRQKNPLIISTGHGTVVLSF
jgi:hypothetical protein